MEGKVLFPGGKCKAVTLSYDDNMLQDERLLAICKKYGLKITFNINSGIFLPSWIKIAGRLGGRDDIWYCTNGELYSWLARFRAASGISAT
jgi:predicted xylanase/chitin deacetylase